MVLAEKILKCDFCDRGFVKSDDLEIHKNSVHKDKEKIKTKNIFVDEISKSIMI